MQASSSSTLSLAGRLRELGDDDLVALLTLREVRDVRIRDFFDLADALLDPAAIQRTLTTLDRMMLAALASVSLAGTDATAVAATAAPLIPSPEAAERLLESLLALSLLDRRGAEWLAYAPVLDVLAGWPRQDLPDRAELVSVPAPGVVLPVRTTDTKFIDHVAGERAFDATNAVTALVVELQRDPARELARGGIALPETKRLASALSLELDAVAPTVAIAARAGLAVLEAGSWMATDQADGWLLRSGAERWAHLAGAWLARLPDDIRELVRARARADWGDRLADYLNWYFPAGGDWMRDRVATLGEEADALGITSNGSPSTAGSALLAQGEAAAADAIRALFPAEIDRVYVQHDLSIIAPGPLVPRLDARLRGMADVESRALATTYRVTESTVNRALTTGETAASIRSFLDEISLTGIPQPLDYLITGSAARFGSLRVGTITEAPTTGDQRGAQTYLKAEDAAVLSAIMVDHGLVPLGLTRVGPYRAVSRFELPVVFWSLSEARYPVAAEDGDGRIVLLDRARTSRGAREVRESPAEAIVHRLRAVAEPTPAEDGKAWLERQLDAAIRSKLALTVTVAMPDGSSVELQLEPASVAGGRLRARDRRSDLERTLPLSSITAVAPLA